MQKVINNSEKIKEFSYNLGAAYFVKVLVVRLSKQLECRAKAMAITQKNSLFTAVTEDESSTVSGGDIITVDPGNGRSENGTFSLDLLRGLFSLIPGGFDLSDPNTVAQLDKFHVG